MVAPIRHRISTAVRTTPTTFRAIGTALRATPVASRAGTRVARRWARQPRTRLVVPSLGLLLGLVAAGGTGGFVVPHLLAQHPPTAIENPGQTGDDSAEEPDTQRGWFGFDPDRPGAGGSSPVPSDTSAGKGVPGSTARPGGGRPADALAGWANQVSSKVSVPMVALEAYGYAELVLARDSPACHLRWTTLAGVGKIESNHGRVGSSALGADGRIQPPIIGVALDGRSGHDAIPDTDSGRLDADKVWDRAVGPMQFIPSTWQRYAVDADLDGVADPNNIHDAALTAGTYLCATGHDLSTADGWYASVLGYNAVRAYAVDVFAAANDYGVRSRN